MYDFQYIFCVVVTCALRGSTETNDCENLNLGQIFRTPKDFSRVNFDHLEILERNNFDSPEINSCTENNALSGYSKHHPKSFANAQVMLRFGGDDVKETNHIDKNIPQRVEVKVGQPYPIQPNLPHHHHHYPDYDTTNEIGPSYHRYPMPARYPYPPFPDGQFPFSLPYPTPPRMYYPVSYYPVFGGNFNNVHEVIPNDSFYSRNPFLGSGHQKNIADIINTNLPKILKNTDLSNEIIPKNSQNLNLNDNTLFGALSRFPRTIKILKINPDISKDGPTINKSTDEKQHTFKDVIKPVYEEKLDNEANCKCVPITQDSLNGENCQEHLFSIKQESNNQKENLLTITHQNAKDETESDSKIEEYRDFLVKKEHVKEILPLDQLKCTPKDHSHILTIPQNHHTEFGLIKKDVDIENLPVDFSNFELNKSNYQDNQNIDDHAVREHNQHVSQNYQMVKNELNTDILPDKIFHLELANEKSNIKQEQLSNISPLKDSSGEDFLNICDKKTRHLDHFPNYFNNIDSVKIEKPVIIDSVVDTCNCTSNERNLSNENTFEIKPEDSALAQIPMDQPINDLYPFNENFGNFPIHDDSSSTKVTQRDPVAVYLNKIGPVSISHNPIPNKVYFIDVELTQPQSGCQEVKDWLNMSLVPYECNKCGKKLLVSYPISKNLKPSVISNPESSKIDFSVSDCPCCKLYGYCHCKNCQCKRDPSIPYGKRFNNDVDSLYKITKPAGKIDYSISNCPYRTLNGYDHCKNCQGKRDPSIPYGKRFNKDVDSLYKIIKPTSKMDFSISDCPCHKLNKYDHCKNCQGKRDPSIPNGKRFNEDVDSLYKITKPTFQWVPRNSPNKVTLPATEIDDSYKTTSSSGLLQIGNQMPELTFNGYTTICGGRHNSHPYGEKLYTNPCGLRHYTVPYGGSHYAYSYATEVYKQPIVYYVHSKPDYCKPKPKIDNFEKTQFYKIVPKYQIVPKTIKPLIIPELTPTKTLICCMLSQPNENKMLCHREYIVGDHQVLIE